MISKSTNLIMGAPETGKTRGIMFPEVDKLIKEEKNLFILDNKEEYYRKFKKELENKGYKTILINLTNPKNSNGFNVLSYPYHLYSTNADSDLALGLILNFAKNICKSDNTTSDPFWENSASDYLASLIITLFDKAEPEEINLHSLAKLISASDSEEGIRLYKDYLKSLDAESITYRLASTCAFAPIDTRGGILSTLKTLTNPYVVRKELLDTLSTPEFKIEDIKDNKIAIFFEGRNSTNVIANIIIDELLVEIRTTKLEFAFILDNFNELPKLENISELTEYAAFNKIKSYFVTNSIEELKSKYSKYTFDKIANIVKVEDEKDIKIDDTDNDVDYPVLKNESIKVIDTNFFKK